MVRTPRSRARAVESGDAGARTRSAARTGTHPHAIAEGGSAANRGIILPELSPLASCQQPPPPWLGAWVLSRAHERGVSVLLAWPPSLDCEAACASANCAAWCKVAPTPSSSPAAAGSAMGARRFW
eukprot:scaffold112010_cov69-Phaeocystis_antarctica.AAC.2